jgi:HlyD family secretion protein
LLIFGLYLGLRPKPVEVELATVSRGPMSLSVLEEGKTRIRNRYLVTPPVLGFLERVPLRAGAPIVQGETVLARIHPEPAALLNPRTQSEAEARVSAADALIQQRQADLERAKSSAELAERELGRVSKLRKSGAVSEREFDTAELEATVRNRELRGAEFGLKIAEFERKQAEAALLQAQGANPPAGQAIEIKAPVTGYVLNVFEESARVITPGTQIMEVGDTRDLESEIELLSTDAATVQPGAKVAIERWGGDKPLRGSVTLVEPAAFTKVSALGVEEQRVKVRVDFMDPLPEQRQLGDRYRVEARIQTWQSDDVMRVPTGALFRRGNEWMCFVAQSGEATLQRVEVGHNNGLEAEVLGGLTEGQQVILHPPDLIVEGARIKERAK